MTLAVERVLGPSTGDPPQAAAHDNSLHITVVFTSAAWTVTALQRAGALARSLGARIVLLAPQVVPFPLPLESPPVLIDWNEERFRMIARQSPIETVVQIYLCRDRLETLVCALRPKSLVLLGGQRHWWPFTAEKRLARHLRRAGHEVILTETE